MTVTFVADDLLRVTEKRAGYELPIPSAASIKPRRLSFEQFVLGNVTRRGFNRERAWLPKAFDPAPLSGPSWAALRRGPALGRRLCVVCPRAGGRGALFAVLTTGYVAVERADSLSARHSRQDLEALRNSDGELMAMYLTPSERDALAKHHADVDRRAQWLVVVEALQSHNYPRFLSTFFRSPALSLHLLERLISEVPSQIRKHLRHLRG